MYIYIYISIYIFLHIYIYTPIHNNDPSVDSGTSLIKGFWQVLGSRFRGGFVGCLGLRVWG